MRRKVALLALVGLSLVVLSGCGGGGGKSESGYGTVQWPPDTRNQVTITQGVWGNVWSWEGNFMPGSATGTVTPVVREVFIYEPTAPSSCTPSMGGGYTAINTKLVAETTSNSTGFFQVSLPAGKYSVIVKEGQLYWAQYYDSDGYMQTVTVTPGVTSKIQLDIWRDASF